MVFCLYRGEPSGFFAIRSLIDTSVNIRNCVLLEWTHEVSEIYQGVMQFKRPAFTDVPSCNYLTINSRIISASSFVIRFSRSALVKVPSQYSTDVPQKV